MVFLWFSYGFPMVSWWAPLNSEEHLQPGPLEVFQLHGPWDPGISLAGVESMKLSSLFIPYRYIYISEDKYYYIYMILYIYIIAIYILLYIYIHYISLYIPLISNCFLFTCLLSGMYPQVNEWKKDWGRPWSNGGNPGWLPNNQGLAMAFYWGSWGLRTPWFI